MTRFYGYESALQGYAMLRRVFNDSDWALSAHFPRVTHCDLLVRQFGNDLPLTVQCVLCPSVPHSILKSVEMCTLQWLHRCCDAACLKEHNLVSRASAHSDQLITANVT